MFLAPKSLNFQTDSPIAGRKEGQSYKNMFQVVINQNIPFNNRNDDNVLGHAPYLQSRYPSLELQTEERSRSLISFISSSFPPLNIHTAKKQNVGDMQHAS